MLVVAGGESGEPDGLGSPRPGDALQDLGGWRDAKSVRRYAYLGVEHLAEFVNRRPATSQKAVPVAVETRLEKPPKLIIIQSKRE